MAATALYLRISVDDDNQDVSNSITNQRDLLCAYVAAHPALASGEILTFQDDGWSGTNFERPQVKALLDLARSGGVGCIIVKDLSRWGRNSSEVSEYLDQIFPFLGIRFISVNDRYDSNDFKGQTAPMDIAFEAIMHDLYCKELSVKVRQSYTKKAEKGEFICGEAPFGYIKSKSEKNKLIIDPEAAKTVRRIFEMACGGKSTGQIAAELNAEGVDSPLMYRKRAGRALRGHKSAVNETVFWSDSNVRRILQDERYTGIQVSGKSRKPKPGSRNPVRLPVSEWIKVPNAHEAIIAADVFAKANTVISTCKKRTGVPKKHILFARKMVCGHCGRALEYAGTKYPYYYCGWTRVNTGEGCFDGRMPVDALKPIVLSAVKAEAHKTLGNHEKRRKRSLPNGNAITGELKKLGAQITQLERRGVSLYEDFVDGKISRDTYTEAKAANSAELAKAESRRAEYENQFAAMNHSGGKTDDEPLLKRILDATDVNAEILSLIDRIVVYDAERIEIRLAFGDTNLTDI